MTNKLRLFLFFSLISCILFGGVRDFSLKLYGVNEDFRGIFIYSIVQDQDGFLWIGSDDGLYRFDGKTMVNLNERDSTIGDLVTASAISTDGHLYMGYYQGGISIVEHGRYRKIVKAKDIPNKVNRLYEDQDQVLWGLTQNSGIIRIENGEVSITGKDALKEVIAYDLIRRRDLLYVATNEGVLKLKIRNGELSSEGYVKKSYGFTINALYEDPHEDDVLWVGADEGLYFMDHNDHEELQVVRNAENYRVTAIARDQLQTLWVGTAESGLVEVELKDSHAYRITNFDINHGFPGNQVSSIYVDHENEIWVGTFGRGLVQLNRADFHHYELKKTAGVEGINDIYQVDTDTYYLATANGLVLASNEPGRDSLTFVVVPKTSPFQVTRLLVQEEVIWLGTANRGLIRFNTRTNELKRIELNPVDPGLSHLVRYISEAPDGTLWVSIAANGVYNIRYDGSLVKHLNTRNGFYHNEVYAILPDAAGNVWFGAQAVGLALLKQNGEIDFLTRDEVFPARDINSISQDESGKVWIATSGSGLFSFDGDEFERFDETNGLLSNFCNAVEVDDSGQVWVGHRMGLSLIQPDYHLVRRFNHPAELGETESVLNAVTKDDQGNIWFGNPYGVTKVILPHLQHQIKQRNTHIQDIRLFFDQVDLLKYSEQTRLDNILPSDMEFGHNENHVTFDFVSINLKNPEAIYYQYLLEGYDKNWSPITKSNVATFTNLDPGVYTFKVKESDHPDLWDDKHEQITFEIDYPYWKKWWFYLIQIALMIAVVSITYVISTKVRNLFVIRLMVYVSVFIVFEYIHTELEPYLDAIAGETPILQVGINLALALFLLPVELRLAKYLRHKEKMQKLQIETEPATSVV